MKLLKKTLGIALALVLLVSLAAPASAAAKATAATMKLQSISGTVTITKASGKAVSYKAGMTLYSGYTITTASKSYANVSLDGSKVLKVDAGSSVSINKSGKKLGLYVNSGSAFFNVSKKLDSDESMSIQTSTMTAGIRGTSGVASAGDVSSFALFDGRAAVVYLGGASPVTVTVNAGESLSASPSAGGAAPVAVPITAEDIPGFAAVEIAADPELQQRITNTGALIVAEIIKDAESRFEKEQKDQEEREKAIEQAIKESVTKPAAPAPVAPVGGGSSGGYPPAPIYDYRITTTDNVVNYYTYESLTAIPAGATVALLRSIGSESKPMATVSVTKPAGGETVSVATLDLNGCTLYGSIEVQAGTSLLIIDSSSAKTGKLIDHAGNAIKNYGTCTLQGGTISAEAADTILNSGKLTVSGGMVEQTGDYAGAMSKPVNTAPVTPEGTVYYAVKNVAVDGAEAAAATLTIGGGHISTGEKTPAIFADNTATVTFYSGTITGYCADAAWKEVGTDGTVNMDYQPIASGETDIAVLLSTKKGSYNTRYGKYTGADALDTAFSMMISEARNTITLSADCTMSSGVTIPSAAGKDFALEGGGNTITYTGTDTAFTIDFFSLFNNVNISTNNDVTLLDINVNTALNTVTLTGNGEAPVVQIANGATLGIGDTTGVINESERGTALLALPAESEGSQGTVYVDSGSSLELKVRKGDALEPEENYLKRLKSSLETLTGTFNDDGDYWTLTCSVPAE